MNPTTQWQHDPDSVEHGTRREDDAASPDAAEQTAEPDGQFPENPRGTLDDHEAGEDPVRGNDPNGEDASLAADPDGTSKVAGLRRDDGTA